MIDDAFKLTLDVLFPAPREKDQEPKEPREQAFKIENHPDKDFFVSFLDGVEMITKAFAVALESQGIKQIPAMGEKFNHNLHQALMEVETDQKEPGTIVQVVQDGYTIHDRLLRPAMVGVAKLPSEKKEDRMKDGHINMHLDVILYD